MQEEHFVWSILHFPLHTTLVLVLQSVSILIIWRQAVESMNSWEGQLAPAIDWLAGIKDGNSTLPAGTDFADYAHHYTDNYTVGEIFAS